MQMTTRTTLIVLALDRYASPDFPTICTSLEETLSEASAGCFRRTRIFDDFCRFTLDRLTVSVGFCDIERPGWPIPGHPEGAVAAVLALTTTHPLDQDTEATRNRQKLGQLLIRRIEGELPCLDVRRTERSSAFDEDIYDTVLDSLTARRPAAQLPKVSPDVAQARPLPVRLGPDHIRSIAHDAPSLADGPGMIIDAKALPAANDGFARSLPRCPQHMPDAAPRKPRPDLIHRRSAAGLRSAAAHPDRTVTPLRPRLNDCDGRSHGVAAKRVFEEPEFLADRLSNPRHPLARQPIHDPEAHLRADIREALAMPESPSIPLRLAAQTLNGAAMVLMPPIGGAMIVYASLGRANLVASSRALALSGTALSLSQMLLKATPFSGFL